MTIKRGDIVLVNLEPTRGPEQGKIRPCVVVQNNIANQFSPTTIIVPLTTKISGKEYSTEPTILPEESGLQEKSAVLCNQIRTISIEDRILKEAGTLKPETMEKINKALKLTLALE
ncbi:MAG TPA: type II toxin-antitoxin system PemK/MazF family toxin [archaeon]|nr:type II toxin-antitoxin system PemK/MazF family toxin [archaeon]